VLTVPNVTKRNISLGAAAVFGVALAALLLIALFPVFPRQLNIRVNDIASRTVRAPKSVSFVSEFLSEQRREEAAAAVQPSRVFDPGVRTSQINAYDRLTAQVTQIRALTDETRKRDSLSALGLSPRSVETVIALSDERWQQVAAEGRRVLGDELNVSLDEAAATQSKDLVDSRIGVDFFADEALLAAELVRPLITSTLAVDEEQTARARDSARAAVPPERVNVEDGDVIVATGTRVDEVAIEKLRATGLLESTVEWRNVLAVAIVAAIAAVVVAGYLFVMQPAGITSERHLIALALVMMVPVMVAKFYLPLVIPDDGRHFLAYILPVAAAPILIAALLETDVAVIVSGVIGTLAAFVTVLIPDMSLVTTVGSLDTFRILAVYGLAPIAGVYLVHRAERLNRYLTAGMAVTGVAYAALLATWFTDTDREPIDLAWMALSAGVSGISGGILAAGAFVTVGVLFGVTTRVQLMELSQLNAPLLRRLQDEAPGTFHHSVIVGNLAERATDLVGADPLLARVGCYYHDIGKVLQPGMYIENQMGGDSPHEEMTAEESATAIQQHVLRGLELARHARLPARVQAFIPEHHGTRLVTYFYRKAAERNPEIDPALFQYPGPRPQSKETAIVMLADSTEALIRSATDRSPEQIDRMVEEVIGERLSEGQLDDSDLTLRDLRTIAESFKTTMRAVYHPRVQYPEPTPMEERRRMLRIPMRSTARGASGEETPRKRRRRYEI
jgi:putative nucleotidyltransferase with HDIG domain